jgi:hypothetical protein
MIADKKEFYTGMGLLVSFFVVLVIIFMPIFKGQNGLDYLDGLYNSISKGSAYYIPQMKEDAAHFDGTGVELSLALSAAKDAQRATALFEKSGAASSPSSAGLSVSGDLGRILGNCLDDADRMYANDGSAVAGKYGYNERQVMYDWWTVLKSMEKALQSQKRFKEAKTVAQVNKKAVETAFNFYRIEPQKITEKLVIVIFSLVFYVVYTLWYGFAILFLFEGWGLKLEH